MKKLLFIFTFVMTVGLAEAQQRGEARVQFGGDFGFTTELFGLNFGAEYFLVDRISLAPNHTIYFWENGRASNLNIDARYYFTEGILQWYGMAGFTNNWENPDLIGGDFRTSRAGANLGVGGVLKFADRLAFNPEFKYQLQNNGQAIFRLGLVYLIN
ncbi:hypothetical protein [Litoribacter populi]|uniref:hypothetical protein n=1 Tax=Litoribacter populi TaxID=2598460 RepID=UPI00117F3713|nr:hypothetical protein [Litoribacter populi]